MMKKKVFITALTCGLLAVAAAATAYAQMPGTAVRATIPFDFIVRGKTLPAGKYEIRRINDSPEELMITSLNNHELVMFETEPVDARKIPGDLNWFSIVTATLISSLKSWMVGSKQGVSYSLLARNVF